MAAVIIIVIITRREEDLWKKVKRIREKEKNKWNDYKN